jgi:hypothetical protein
MDVNSVMSTYNLNSLWNSINPNSSSTSSTVPLINNVDSTVQENYSSMNYSGQTTSTELQDIYQQVEPSYGIPLSYNQNGNLSVPISTTLPTNGLSATDSNIISLLNSDNSTSDNLSENILSQYTSIEDGTYNPTLSSILSNNDGNLYNAVNSLETSQQSSGNTIDTTT